MGVVIGATATDEAVFAAHHHVLDGQATATAVMYRKSGEELLQRLITKAQSPQETAKYATNLANKLQLHKRCAPGNALTWFGQMLEIFILSTESWKR